MQPRRLRMARDRGREHVRGVFERLELQQVVAPVEQVLLGRGHVRGLLVLAIGAGEVAGALFDVAEQVVQLSGLVAAHHRCDQRPRLVEFPHFEQREREVVAARLVRCVDGARALQVGQRLLQFALLQIERGELILRLEAVRIAANRFQQPPLDGCRVLRARSRGLNRRGFARGGFRRFRRLCEGSRSCHRDEHEREEKPDPAVASYQYTFAPS